MAFGSDIIIFTSFNPGAAAAFPDDEGTFTPFKSTVGAVPGCRHRPYRQVERGPGGARSEYSQVGVGIATNWWQSTCPPFPAALAAQSSDTITVDGVPYRIINDARPTKDASGRIVKVTFESERQTTTA